MGDEAEHSYSMTGRRSSYTSDIQLHTVGQGRPTSDLADCWKDREIAWPEASRGYPLAPKRSERSPQFTNLSK
jgi:hypothetical protein